jgi:peptidase C13-like protein
MKRSAIAFAFTGLVLLGVGSADRGRAEALNDTKTEPKGYIVALGLSDDLNVFHSEATRAAAILAKHYGRGAPAPLVFTNSRTSRAATVASLRNALARTSSRMDRENDVLFVFLTSHGNQQGVQIKSGKRRSILPPAELAALLRATNVRNKVLIISACYSGVFTPLADARTLVITAADATHPSFGCEETATWTYFGRAFFSQAMPKTNNLQDAFVLARSLILVRELERGYQPSNPQMRGGEDFVTRLRAAP